MKDSKFEKIFVYVVLFALAILIGYNIMPKSGIKKLNKYEIELSMNSKDVDELKEHVINLRRFLNNRDEKYVSKVSEQILSKNLSDSRNWHKLKNNKFTNDAISDICSIVLSELNNVDKIKKVVMCELKYRNIDVSFPIKIN